MLKINKLPINAGMIKFISQIANEAAKMPNAFVLNNSRICMLASHLSPSSVRKVKVGTTAITKKTTLIPAPACQGLSKTPKTGNTRQY
jgi:hypothetical protein